MFEYPCKYGHLGCSNVEGGPCFDEEESRKEGNAEREQELLKLGSEMKVVDMEKVEGETKLSPGGPRVVFAGKKAKKPKPKSRTQRWNEAAAEAVAALEALKDIQSEYEEWKDNLPENLQQSALGEKLDAVCDLDIEGALDTAQEAEGADLPQGFGRD